MIAALRAVLEFFAAEPDLARLFLLESVSATPKIAIRFREAVLACVPALARGRAELDDPDSLLPETENAIVGGTVSLATRAIVTGDPERLPELLPDLVDFTLSPYLGAERAASSQNNLPSLSGLPVGRCPGSAGGSTQPITWTGCQPVGKRSFLQKILLALSKRMCFAVAAEPREGLQGVPTGNEHRRPRQREAATRMRGEQFDVSVPQTSRPLRHRRWCSASSP